MARLGGEICLALPVQRWRAEGADKILAAGKLSCGQAYRALGLKDRLDAMDRAEQLDLLASDGMLVKRPILVDGDIVLVGFKEGDWAARLG